LRLICADLLLGCSEINGCDAMVMHFSSLRRQPSDPILSLADAFTRDARPGKIDLGVGVYRDEQGRTPIMASVKAAEGALVRDQESKAYLGPEGDPEFVSALAHLLVGDRFPDGQMRGVQTVGGTGALRLAAELLALERPERTIWIGTPTWPNHLPIFRGAFADVRTYEQFDRETQRLRDGACLEALEQASPGDVIILHGCCHNPTGVDPDLDGWSAIAELAERRGVLPIIDLAYHGFGDGLDADAAPLRILLEKMPVALIAYSCSKNFGLYRDRVGALLVVGNAQASDMAWSNLVLLARTNYSMPPDHGAAVVRTILQSPMLEREWRIELESYRARLLDLRGRLAGSAGAGRFDLTPLGRQKGFFSLLPLSPEEVDWLRSERGIYMAQSGRINIAGLGDRQLPELVSALAALSERCLSER
jgi:aromatic-amino-acid transaminase